MIHRTTRHRLGVIEGHCPPAALAELQVQREYFGEFTRSKVEVRAAYVAWELARNALIAHCFTDRGSAKVSDTDRTALSDLVRSMNAYDRHPAFAGTALPGHQAYNFPAWELVEPDHMRRRYSPTPLSNHTRFVVLCPRWVSGPGGRFTLWEPDGMVNLEDRLVHEFTHDRIVEP